MKIKNILLAINTLLLLISISQIFSIPPFANDIFPVYKSGYFIEIDKGFKIIIDAFTAVKTNGRAETGWIFLNDNEKSTGIKAAVYNKKGERVIAPSYYDNNKNADILKILTSVNPETETIINSGKYKSIIPARAEKKCIICHSSSRENEIIGAFYFERKFNAYIYYTSERIIIFSLISLLLLIMLIITARWDPERQIKELFDKKN
jgi:hypothetical protein